MHMWEMSMKRTMNLGTAPCTFSSLAQNYLGTGALCVICHPWKSIKCFHDSNPDVIFWMVGQSSRTPQKKQKTKQKLKMCLWILHYVNSISLKYSLFI